MGYPGYIFLMFELIRLREKQRSGARESQKDTEGGRNEQRGKGGIYGRESSKGDPAHSVT
jgi:hypothetical protein